MGMNDGLSLKVTLTNIRQVTTAKFKVRARNKIRDTLRKAATKYKQSLRKTTEYWEGSHYKAAQQITEYSDDFIPHFSPRRGEKISVRAREDFTIEIYPDAADEHGNLKWHWLNEGTEIRRVHLKRGYSPKTKKNDLQSVEVEGNEVSGLGRKEGGIEARNWSDLAIEENEREVDREFLKVLNQLVDEGILYG